MAVWMSMILVILNTLHDVTVAGKPRTYYGVWIDYFWACENRTVANRIENTTVHQVSRDFLTVDADILVVRGSSKLPARMVVLRCATRADEVCEPFLRMAEKDFCHIFTDRGQFWTVFYDSVTPRPRCPMTEGRYEVRNATIDFDQMFREVPPLPEAEDYYWKFRTHIYSASGEEELLCVTSGGKLEKFKKRS